MLHVSVRPPTTPHLNVLEVLYVGCVVSVPLAVLNDLKPPSADGVHHWATIREELHITDLQQAPVVCKPGVRRQQ